MGNSIKYTTGTESNSLSKGNFRIGTGDVGKGPTSSTGFYRATTPPSGGYRIYLYNTSVSGNIAYHTAANDSELISFTNNLAGTSYITANECLVYFAGQTDKICVNRDYEEIITDGLVWTVDAGFTASYPKSGSTSYNLSGGNNGTLTNGVSYSSNNGGTFVFDGVDDYITFGASNQILSDTYFTMECWIKSSDNGTGSGTQATFIGTRVGKNASLARFGAGDKAMFYWDTITEGNINLNSNTVVFDEEWHHIVGTFDNGLGSIYVDGEFKNSASSTAPIDLSNATFGMGNDISNRARTFNGQIPIGRVYNRVLSSSEILQNYNAQKGRFGL